MSSVLCSVSTDCAVRVVTTELSQCQHWQGTYVVDPQTCVSDAGVRHRPSPRFVGGLLRTQASPITPVPRSNMYPRTRSCFLSKVLTHHVFVRVDGYVCNTTVL